MRQDGDGFLSMVHDCDYKLNGKIWSKGAFILSTLLFLLMFMSFPFEYVEGKSLALGGLGLFGLCLVHNYLFDGIMVQVFKAERHPKPSRKPLNNISKTIVVITLTVLFSLWIAFTSSNANGLWLLLDRGAATILLLLYVLTYYFGKIGGKSCVICYRGWAVLSILIYLGLMAYESF